MKKNKEKSNGFIKRIFTKIKISFRAGLVTSFAILISLPLIAITGISYVQISNNMSSMTQDSTSSLLKEIENEMITYFDSVEHSIVMLSEANALTDGHLLALEKKTIGDSLESYIGIYDTVSSAFVVFEDGYTSVFPNRTYPENFDPRQQLWYTKAIEAQGAVWTEPFIETVTGEMVTTVSMPVYNFNDEIVGVVAAEIELNKLAELLNNIKVGKEGYPFLLTADSITITHKNPELIGVVGPVEELNNFMQTNDSGFYEYTYGGEEKIAFLETVDGLGWKLLATLPSEEIYGTARTLSLTISAIGGVLLLAAIVIAFAISQWMAKSVKKISKRVERLKNGDFKSDSLFLAIKEFSDLSVTIEDMRENVSSLIENVVNTTETVNQSASEMAEFAEEASESAMFVSKAVEDIAKGSVEQAEEVELANLNTKEAGDQVDQLLVHIDFMVEKNKNVTSSNEAGKTVVEELKVANLENNRATQETATAIHELEMKSETIGMFVETITSIAGQTNLLSLNASIEAARAGEQGLGFAVVANEIRKLADESNQAAIQIKEIVEAIQSESRHAVKTVSEVSKRSEEQSKSVVQVEESFGAISESIDAVNAVIADVQSGIENIKIAMQKTIQSAEKIAVVTEESAAATEEANASMEQQSSSVKEVASLAESLNQLTEKLSKELSNFII